MNLNKLAIECLKGKSLWRTLCNIKLSEFKVYGELLDAGSKNLSSSYYRYLDTTQVKGITFVDYYSSDSLNILKVDLEKEIPIKDFTYDSVLLMNVLEHVFNYSLLLKELHRITKENGTIIGSVPFMFRYHADPNDFNRFTHTSLKRNLVEAGFKEINIYTVGDGLLISIAEQISRLLPNIKMFLFFRLILWISAIFLSKLKIFRKEDIKYNDKQASYLGLVFKAKK